MMPGYHAVVYVDGNALDINLSKIAIHDYNADSAEWGYFGSGPSQTAAAILYDLTNDVEVTKKYHQDFKREFIATFDQNGFILIEVQIRNWLENMLKFEGGEYGYE
jgi:hypothetical protein